MAGLTTVNEVLHRIRVKLYPNYLPQIKGEYIARTDSEKTLSVDEVKIAGDPGKTGVYLTMTEQPFLEMKMSASPEVNDAGKIIGILPNLLPGKEWALEVRTQFSTSTTLLKEVRVIKAGFVLAS
jgi:hypothetical protein